MQWKTVISVVVIVPLLLPLNASAEEVKILGGGFQFLHPPINPAEPDGVCFDPLGLLFSVTSESFDGLLLTKKGKIPFMGTGDASGCAYLEPFDGVAAEFSGSFTWQTADGELRGTFELLDFPTEFEGVFSAVIFMAFDGGTGRFKKAWGEAFAVGLDFPFGGLSGDPSTAGVLGTIVAGELNLKR